MLLQGDHLGDPTLWLYLDPRLSQLMDTADSGSDSWRYQDQ